jgi:hypothetical protein
MCFHGIERGVCGSFGEGGCFWGCIGRFEGNLGQVIDGGEWVVWQ